MGSDEPPGKKLEKLKSENMQKGQFSMFILYFESNQGRQAGVENGAIVLTTYLFIYSSECTIS